MINANDFNNFAEDLRKDENLLKNILDDGALQSSIKKELTDNYERSWLTKGKSINGNWGGRTLVQTGATKRSFTTSSNIKIRQSNNVIFPSVRTTTWAQYLEQKYTIIGTDKEADNNILEAIIQSYLNKSSIF